MPTYTLQGGPQDGQSTDAPAGHFTEGDFVAVNYKSFSIPKGQWSGEVVYRVEGTSLIYDPVATEERAAVVANNPAEAAKMNPVGDDFPPCLPFMLLELVGEFMRSAKVLEAQGQRDAAVSVATAAEWVTEVVEEFQESFMAWQIRRAATKNQAAGIGPQPA